MYFLPMKGWSKYVLAFTSRFMAKVVADVTGLLMLRNTYELGGSYFAFNIVASQAGCWIAAKLYVDFFYGEIKN